MNEAIRNDVNRRHDIVMLFDVTDGNPNGDPDAGNLPRVDPETMKGLVTDVCLKRKVRNFINAMTEGKERYNIYVEHHGVLNAQHRKAYVDLKLPLGTPVSELVPTAMYGDIPDGAGWPDGFYVETTDAEPPQHVLHYTGELDADGLAEALKNIKEDMGDNLDKFAKGLAKKSGRPPKPSRENIEKARKWMCANFFDIRMFGAVMSTGVNCGQVRGPLQLTFARSIDAITPLDLSITRVAVTKEEDSKKKETEMGRKALVPYGLYLGYGFYNAALGKDTGVTGADLALFWDALQNMWDMDRSASRGFMALRGLYVFSHEKPYGNAPAHVLFDRIAARKKDGIQSPRAFSDYEVRVNEKDLPAGVTLTRVAC